MTLAIINGPTVIKFVEDGKDFENCVKECFEMLDVNGDGMISRDELCEGFNKLMWVEMNNNKVYDAIFERFDEDKNGSIDNQEFRRLMREIMFAMARGIGNSPVLVALDTKSLLMKVVEFEHQHDNK